MSTATIQVRTGVVMQATHVRPTINLIEIVRRIRALRALSQATGFSTNRTVGELLEKLTPDDLIKVGEMFLPDLNDNDTK
jgi:hypothetical protein